MVMATLPEGEEKRRQVEDMFDRVAPQYDRMNRLISLGLHRGWRNRTVTAWRLPSGSRVPDLACCTVDLCDDLEQVGVRAFGIDSSAGMLGAAHTRAPLVRVDALRLPFADSS